MDVLLGQYGILKVTQSQFDAMEKQYLLRVMKESYGYRCLTREKQFYMENYPNLALEKGNVDEVIAMMVKGEAI